MQRLQEGREEMGASLAPGPTWSCVDSGMARVHIGIDLPAGSELDEVSLYLRCSNVVRDSLVWSRWATGAGNAVVPGSHERLGHWHQAVEGEVLRTRADRTLPVSPHDRNFVHLELPFVEKGRGQAPAAVEAGIGAGHLPSMPQRCWIQVEVEGLEDLRTLAGLSVLPDCVVAFNCHQRTFVVSGGVEPEQRITLDAPFEEIFRIDEVRDAANAVIFESAESSEGLHSAHRYYMDMDVRRDAQLRLSASSRVVKPRSFEVDLVTTLGSDADGLDPGSICVIHDRSRCPGVEDAVNVASSLGGLDAESLPEHAEELRAALTSRGRAVTHNDFAKLARNFDPGLVDVARVHPGVKRTEDGVVRCVEVRIHAREGSIRSEAHRQAFEAALHDYLQARATAGVAVRVRVEDEREAAV